MHSVWLLHNLRAGVPAYARDVRRAAEALSRRGISVELAQTADIDALRVSAHQAVQAGADAVLVAGGDGTLGAIAGELAASPVALGVLPAGTANVWARVMGLPRPAPLRPGALERAASQLLEAPARSIDMGRCDDRWFLVWAGVGLDAYITQRFEAKRQVSRQMGGFFYNVGLTFVAARGWQGLDLRLSASGPAGDSAAAGHFLMATICNIGWHGGGLFRFSADFRLDDGVMDLWAFEGVTYGQALRLAWAVHQQKHVGHPGVHRLTGDHFELEADSPTAVQTDGEPRPPAARLVVDIVPRTLRLLVPHSTAGEFYLSDGSGA
jgi:diacylglycerol kinase family enzyme